MAPLEIQRLCDELDAALRGGVVPPEDVARRTRMLEPLEEAVAALTAPPDGLRDTPAGKIARLLWGKRHPAPGPALVPAMLASIRDDAPWVRATAAEVLDSVLRVRPLDPGSARQAQAAVEDQLTAERSPLISYQLRELQERLRAAAPTRPRRSTRKEQANPYIAGLPIRQHDRFVGRDDIFAEIRDTFREGGGVSTVIVQGARRTGKTSLLLRIEDGVLGDRFVPVYLDLQRIGGVDERRFLWAITAHVHAVLHERGIDVPPQAASPDGPEPVSLPDFFRAVLRFLPSRSLVLLVDEYEVLERYFENRTVAGQFQALFEQETGLCWVFAGSKKIEALGGNGAFFPLEVAKYIKISFLKADEARKLITAPAEGMLRYEPAAVDRILALTGGHPFYTQLLGELLFDLTIARGTVTVTDVEEAVNRFIRNPSPHVILTWNGLGFEQQLVSAVAARRVGVAGSTFGPADLPAELVRERYPLALQPGDVHRAIADLRGIDWIDKRIGEEAYRFTMDLVRKWIAENRSIWDLLDVHRAATLARLPRARLHVCAWPIDFLLLLVLLVPALVTSALQLLPVGVAEGVALAGTFAYFVATVWLARGTPGMRLTGLRALTSTAAGLRGWRALGFALLLEARLAIWVVTSIMTIGVALMPGAASLHLGIAVGALALLVVTEVLDVSMMRFGARGQGLYERIAGVVVVRSAEQ